ncbi:uncharacterized protein LOC106663581 [Cimex lectularius]|uniref:C2H2-type domain-containing protein n=1 Tax=Cimex lectularius TaxID=79782 RepID=A0A8I6TCI6_CIMLE|nr:uncharacterized protein LOC106663581 [Cimex lectularius]
METRKHQCTICLKTFTKKSNLKRHEHTKHGCGDASWDVYTCGSCFKSFKTKFSLTRHLKTHSNSQNDSKSQTRTSNLIRHSKIPSKHLKKCPICGNVAPKHQLIEHYKNDHGISLSKETLCFKDKEEFFSWKETIEQHGHSFVVNRSNYKRNDQSSRTLYKCHRDGTYVYRGQGKRHLKMLGSNKIDGYCPAQLDVMTTESMVVVKYVSTHVGHSLEINRLRLAQKDRDSLAQKISMNIPFDNILDEVRHSISPVGFNRRIHLLTKKDLFNIEKLYKLNRGCKRNYKDNGSVQSWVSRMEETTNIVRFYKPQGAKQPDRFELNEDDFILVLANDAQLEYLAMFGNDCICVDEIRGLNPHNFNLTTLFVLDDLRQAFPCAFLLSNRSSEDVMTVFFSVINENLHFPITPNIFMSDMTDTCFNAWKTTLSEPKFRLFSPWHVDHAWREILNDIKDSEKQFAVYKLLQSLLEETDESAFIGLLESTINTLITDPATENFGNYFIDNYSNNAHCWAYCFRQNTNLNTNVHIERMHKTIKHLFLSGKKVKRPDVALNALMGFVRDKLYNRLTSPNKAKSKIAELRRRHNQALSLDRMKFVKENDIWKFPSSTSSEIYTIEKENLDCTCGLQCEDCKFCVHAYTCSCLDSTIKWNMCKHIHALGGLLNDGIIEASVVPNPSLEVLVIENASENIDTNNIVEQLIEQDEEEIPTMEFSQRKKEVTEEALNILNKAKTLDDLDLISKTIVALSTMLDMNKCTNNSLQEQKDKDVIANIRPNRLQLDQSAEKLLVEKHPTIYNINLKDHSTLTIVDNIWEEIAAEVELL